MSYSGYDSYGQAEPQTTFSDAGADVASAFKDTGSDRPMGSSYYRATYTPALYGRRLNYPQEPSITQTTKNDKAIKPDPDEEIHIDEWVEWEDEPLSPAARKWDPSSAGPTSSAASQSPGATPKYSPGSSTNPNLKLDPDEETCQNLMVWYGEQQVAATSTPGLDPIEEEHGAIPRDPVNPSDYDMSTPNPSAWDPHDMALRGQETSFASQYSNTTLPAAYSNYQSDYSESPGWSIDYSNSSIPKDASPGTQSVEQLWSPDAAVDPSAYSGFTSCGIQGGAGSSRQPRSGSHLPLRRPHGPHGQSHQNNRRSRHGAR